MSSPRPTPTDRQASIRTGAAGPLALEPIAADQAPILDNLFQLYAHDFSEFVPLALHPDGRFDTSIGTTWWARDDHLPFFLRWNGDLCGFALIRRGSRLTGEDDVLDVAEFFVARGVRGQGVGRSAAHSLFVAFRGRWEIRVRRANAPASAFWRRTAESWLGRPVASDPYSVDGVEWEVFRLDSAERAGCATIP